MTRFAGVIWRPGYDDHWLGARDLSSFRLEGDFSQTTSIAGPRLNRSRTVATGNPLWRHVLTLPFTNFPRRHTVHHPKCVRPQNSPSLRKSESCRIPVPSTVLCSKRNIILEWLIALRARASRVPDVGLGLLSDSKPNLEKARQSSGRVAQRRSVGRNLNSKSVKRGSLSCHCRFSSVATSIDLNCPDRQKRVIEIVENLTGKLRNIPILGLLLGRENWLHS